MDKKYKGFVPISAALFAAFSFHGAFAASNFTITATGTQPTSVVPGSSVSAFYTITNLTQSTRSAYAIKGLPATVKQNVGNGYCSNPMTLPARGSCVLKLDISGEAKSYFSLCRGASCTQSATPLNVSASSQTTALLAAGQYRTHNFAQTTSLPLIVASSDEGTSWAYTLTGSNLPAGVTGATIYATSCSSSACIAVGYFADINDNQSPMLAVGNAAGTNWTYKTLPAPSLNEGSMASVSCTEKICVVSAALGTDPNIQPSIFTSTDNGQTWNNQLISGLQPAATGAFAKVLCNSKTCIATGFGPDQATTKYIPMFAKGDSNGTNWSYATVNNVDPTKQTLMMNAHCNTTTCAAVGTIIDTSSFPPQALPTLMISTDLGVTWSFAAISNLPVGSGMLTGIYCNNQACLADGYAQISSDITPILTVGDASGSNWTYQSFTLPAGATTGALRSLSCSNNACVVVGSADNGLSGYPIIATGSLNGTNWTYTYSNMTEFTNSMFNSITCNANNCLAAGGPGNGVFFSTSYDYAMAFFSKDNGVTWTNVVNQTTPASPSGMLGGTLNTTSIGSASTSFLRQNS